MRKESETVLHGLLLNIRDKTLTTAPETSYLFISSEKLVKCFRNKSPGAEDNRLFRLAARVESYEEDKC